MEEEAGTGTSPLNNIPMFGPVFAWTQHATVLSYVVLRCLINSIINCWVVHSTQLLNWVFAATRMQANTSPKQGPKRQ